MDLAMNTQTKAIRSLGQNNALPCDERLSYRVPEVQALTGLGRSTVYELIANGTLPSRLISGCRLVLRADLLTFLQGK
jgi:excisionase family DNA binding protein